MNKKKLLIFMLGIPIIIIFSYVYFLMNMMKKPPSADILQPTASSSSSEIITASSSSLSTVSTGDIGSIDASNVSPTGIKIYMPTYFENVGYRNLKKKLFVNYRIKSDYTKIDDLKQYQDKLLLELAKGSSEIDVFMVPIDWLDTFKSYGYKIEFKKDISPFFNYMFYDYIKDSSYTFIPYAIDPLVTVYANNMFDGNISIEDIKNSIMIIDSTENRKKYYFPTLFGLGNYDITLLKNNKELYTNYFLVFYQIMEYIIDSKDSKMLEFFISLNGDEANKYWDPVKFKKISTMLESKNKNCEYFKPMCLVSRGLGGFYFGFTSDIDIYERYFTQDTKIKSLGITNFPMISTNYPVRGWGFVINKNSKNLEASNIFINEYIKESLDGKNAFWTNTISAFNLISDQQKLDNKFGTIIKYFDKFNLISGDLNLQERFVKDTKIIDVLEGKYSINAFVDNIDWDF